jgi:hypothetical protein
MSPHEVDRSGTAASHDSVVPPNSRPTSDKSMDEADLGARPAVKNPARSRIFRWLEQKFADTRSLTISAAGWVIALVAMVKVDMVIGSLVVGSASHTPASIQAPLQSPAAVAAVFNDWAQAAGTVPLRDWIILQWWLDMALIVAYTVFLLGVRQRWGVVPLVVIWGLALADVAENVFGLMLTYKLPRPGDTGSVTDFANLGLTTWITVATTMKFALILILSGALVYALLRPRAAAARRTAARSPRIQRFSHSDPNPHTQNGGVDP